jgi:surfeit locus 1 family protein|tara:strand:- start:21197 stop:21919 length:723 start_codon:yes stop_codon:yes gene_type:complete
MVLFKTRPTVAISISAGLALLILLVLGVWQVERLFWKENLIAQREAQASMAPIDFPVDVAKIDPDLSFRAVRAHGRFLHDQEMYLMARTMQGSVGYQVITPLEQADGRIILVNRGWVPDDKRDPATRAQGQVAGQVDVTGVLQVARPRHWAQPENDPVKNQWFFVDPQHMAEEAGGDLASPYYLEADATPNPGGWPKGGQAHVTLPNNHLQYAITWFSLAVALVVIFIIYHRRPALPKAD